MGVVSVHWIDKDDVLQHGDASSLPDSLNASWAWVDVLAPDQPVIDLLASTFDLHPLAVEDVRHPQARAKLDIYPESLFFAWLTPRRRVGDGVVVDEIDVFLGAKYLITLHDSEVPAITHIAEEAGKTLRSGADWTLHAIIDLQVDTTMPLIDEIGEELNTIEDAMLETSPRQEDLRDLHQVRRQLVRLHRIVAPERDVLHALARERDVVSEEAYRYFLDVADHVARVLDSIETYQDVGASVMDVYLSAQNNRMNEIMKQLTVVATIFMPLTLMSGIYGMNLVAGMWPSPLRPWSFGLVVLSMLVIALTMAAYFRKKKWW
jgi:magnesium transporter